MNEVALKENVMVEDMIYEVRGKHVIFDFDLVLFYGTLTKELMKQ